MADAETFLQFLTGVMHKRIIGARLGADEMRRQRRRGGANGQIWRSCTSVTPGSAER